MRKSYLILAASLLLVLLVACATTTVKTEEKEDVKTAEEPKEVEKQTVSEKVVETKKEAAPTDKVDTEAAPSPEPVKKETKEPAKTIPTVIKDIISRADTKLTSIVYLYGSAEHEGRFLNTYHVRGDKIKVKLYEDNYYVQADYFDTVYLDTSLKTATGRCENRRRCMSSQLDNTVKVFPATYDDYRRKTPYEWLQDITAGAEMIGPEVVDKRSVQKIEYPKKDHKVEMWIDKMYGVPLQVKIIYPNEEEEMYQFTNVQFNTLKEEDVVPAFLVEQQSPMFPDAPVN